jgi:hypothetical protein
MISSTSTCDANMHIIHRQSLVRAEKKIPICATFHVKTGQGCSRASRVDRSLPVNRHRALYAGAMV